MCAVTRTGGLRWGVAAPVPSHELPAPSRCAWLGLAGFEKAQVFLVDGDRPVGLGPAAVWSRRTPRPHKEHTHPADRPACPSAIQLSGWPRLQMATGGLGPPDARGSTCCSRSQPPISASWEMSTWRLPRASSPLVVSSRLSVSMARVSVKEGRVVAAGPPGRPALLAPGVGPALAELDQAQEDAPAQRLGCRGQVVVDATGPPVDGHLQAAAPVSAICTGRRPAPAAAASTFSHSSTRRLLHQGQAPRSPAASAISCTARASSTVTPTWAGRLHDGGPQLVVAQGPQSQPVGLDRLATGSRPSARGRNRPAR